MMADVRDGLERGLFVPFVVPTSDGHEYPVPGRDHAHISPRGNRVVIFLHAGPAVLLGPVHINTVVEQPNGE